MTHLGVTARPKLNAGASVRSFLRERNSLPEEQLRVSEACGHQELDKWMLSTRRERSEEVTHVR